MATPALLRSTEASARAYRQTWRGSVFSTIVTPVLYLAAMGAGLGSLVDDRPARPDLGGVPYLAFLAPGLLAAAAMQTAATEATWPLMAGFKWRKTFEVQSSTPLTPRDVALGQLLWIAVRVTMTAIVFALVVAAFRAGGSWWLVAAVPAAVLTGLAYAAPVMAYTARTDQEYALSNLYRFGIVPMFLFSGTFFPVEQLPEVIRPVAYAVPLWHGVRLCRGLALDDLGGVAALLHVAYLAVWVAAGTGLTVASFRRRLIR